tara:strand:+ start:406 stop:705 length:300 start_codon:yes stop_codon:yes gene_type:complete
MNSDITNIVRSVVFLGCALPLTIALANRVGVGTEVARRQLTVSPADQVVIDLKNDLTKACLDYKLSKVDTKVERQSKNDIDEVFEGEVLYNATCNYVLG